MRVVPDWKEMTSALRVIVASSFAGFLVALVIVGCMDEYHIGKSKEELYKEMFKVDSLIKTIQLQIDSTSIDFQKIYIDSQRINNGHE
jgi:hypothetical protein|tara:strand:- start:968 stop:1231 length:264 start_codon:yes stop_codon:yes gene_type:complete